MDEAIAQRLVELNAAFYTRFAAPFADSRASPQPGFERLLPYLPPGGAVLDVGCGDGRFARFLHSRKVAVDYTGIDFSLPLLQKTDLALGRYVERDLSRPNCLAGFGQYDAVLCLSTLQHIPGRANRLRLLAEMRDHLRPRGTIALANWQFAESERQLRKVRPWSAAGLEEADLEAGDTLLAWRRGGEGLRYVALLDIETITGMVGELGMRVVEQFRSDGREGNLNLYTILAS